MIDTNGNTNDTCPVCGVHHFAQWELNHELTRDKGICEDCAWWADTMIPCELSDMMHHPLDR